MRIDQYTHLRYGAFLLIGAPTLSTKVRGMDISYWIRNPMVASPTLLLVHGFSGAKIALLPLVKALPKSWRVVALDLPGHGESGFNAEQSYTCAGMGDILNEVRFHETNSSCGVHCVTI